MKRKRVQSWEMAAMLQILAALVWTAISVVVVGLIILVTTPSHPETPPVVEYKISQDVVKMECAIKVKTMQKQAVLEDDLEEQQWTDSLEYLAACVEAEAGNQSELGKRLVCDVILNRYDSGDYETLYDVINEPGQFSVVSNGMIKRVVPSEETYQAVQKELRDRTNREVLFFREGCYHNFGTPLLSEGDHYFSKGE